jgi:hypothetical protein
LTADVLPKSTSALLHGTIRFSRPWPHRNWAIVDSHGEVFQAFVDQRRVLLRQRLHHLLGRLDVAFTVVVETGGLQRRSEVLVRFSPVDHADSIGGLGILGIDRQHLLLPGLGIVQLLDL